MTASQNNDATDDKQTWRFGEYELDIAQRTLRCGGDAVTLQKRAFDLLVYLIEIRSRAVSKDELQDAEWPGVIVTETAMTRAVMKARKATGDDSERQAVIRTVHAHGYQFVADLQEQAPEAASGIDKGDPESVSDRSHDDSPSQAHPPRGIIGRLLQAVAALVILTIAVGSLWELLQESSRQRAGQSPPPAEAGYSTDAIAVLPFINMSADVENEFFSDGVTEELINVLTRIEGLKVVGRTSAFAFKGSQDDLRAIGQALGAGSVVEGSVRRMGNRVRVTAQLINASDGFQRWSQTFDRDLTDIFAILASELQVTLGFERSLDGQDRPTEDLEAYTSYLRGQWLLRQPSLASMRGAMAAFREAAERDPGFAEAQVGLAAAYVSLYEWAMASIDEVSSGAEAALNKALELDPELGRAHAILGELKQFQGDYAEARRHARHAMELSPRDSFAYSTYGYLSLVSLGDPANANAYLARAAEFDPVWLSNNATIAESLEALGRTDEAMEMLAGILRLEPTYMGAYWRMGRLHSASLARPDEALIWQLRAAEHNLDNSSWIPLEILWVSLTLGMPEEARWWADEAERANPGHPLTLLGRFHLESYLGNEAASGVLAALVAKGDRHPDYQNTGYTRWLRELAWTAPEQAARVFERLYPELTAIEPQVEAGNLGPALAQLILHRESGRFARVMQLQRLIEAVIRDAPRLGAYGTGIADVLLYSILGESDQSAQALGSAIDAGWRDGWWQLEQDPSFDVLRRSPAFDELKNRLRRAASQARASAIEMAAGDGPGLRSTRAMP
jgi:TolB-like protein/DNA-binding winged helix-turn-helix (wHTH) protein